MRASSYLFLAISLLLSWNCTDQTKGFKPLSPSQTGVEFSNDILTNDTFNAIYFEYIYNGGGVAASDVNGDGNIDLFFTGNQVSSRLYLNRGQFQFEDVTLAAGLETNRWCTGVAIADVNDDGKKDIYISVAGHKVPREQMENLLYINQGWDEDGIPRFVESAKSYGLNDAGYSTQAAFFDYDLDGDLDLYLLSNAMEKYNRNNIRPKRINGEAESTDRLYRNNGDETFSNVSQEAGILTEGYGLGVQITDLNFDGYPDVYAANDFLSNDLVWVNNGDGSFTNKAAIYLKHQTHNGMGVDIADFTNDARPEIVVLDMLPEDNYRQKIMIPNVNNDKFLMKKQLGYQDQYMRNTVQLHQGFSVAGEPRFSEISNLTGMASTDWSWSVLLADFDNDGWKDAYITNGYRKDITNLDYINYSSSNQMFGTDKAKKEKAFIDLSKIPDVKISNYLFHNKGDLNFKNVASEWGLDIPSFSNGAVYADLDNDGDLDLAINNIDAPAFIFENKFRTTNPQSHNYLQIILEEQHPKLTPYNSKILVYAGDAIQYQEYSPFRGYKSTMSDIVHFGLGNTSQIDSVVVFWPDNKKSILTNIPSNQRVTISYQDGMKNTAFYPGKKKKPVFQKANTRLEINFQHSDNGFSDLNTTRTLLFDHSKVGPAIATGDINGDGLEDFFVGGNKNQAGQFFIQNEEGTFDPHKFLQDSSYQDTDALLFDADGDKDQDLYVVSGGTSEAYPNAIYQDRLYLNDGSGNFSASSNAMPNLMASGSCVRASDFDSDGDLDLFIGGRSVPGKYPFPARSYLLINEDGLFTDSTPVALQEAGMITDAIWTDFNNDQQQDLILVGDWMPITFFENNNGQLQPAHPQIDQKTNGWWIHINEADFDGDGDMDYLLGNFGLNSKIKAGQTEPVKLITKDFDDNGALDPLLSCYIQGQPYLMHQRDLLISQIPGMKRRFPNYTKYAEASLSETLSKNDLEGAHILESYMLASILLENKGRQGFIIHTLPMETQLSPLAGSLCFDFDQNGTIDILSAGNFQATETTQIGWFDASYGSLLLQNATLNFQPANPVDVNLEADGDVRTLKSLTMGNGQKLLLFGVYGGPLKAYLVEHEIKGAILQ